MRSTIASPTSVLRRAKRPRVPPGVSSEAAARKAEEYAARAVDLALEQAAGGAHFLMGAAGATPAVWEGTDRCPGGVRLARARTDPIDPSVFAARPDMDAGPTCAGRFNELSEVDRIRAC